MKRKKIAITSDKGLDQRLISKLADLNNIELVSVSRQMISPNKEQHLQQVSYLMQKVDGLILPGNGYDIDPYNYKEASIHPKNKLNSDPDDIRFDVEKTMLLCAIERKLPIVAICGGMQLVNVVLGGDLVQHLPDNSNNIIHKDDLELDDQIIENWEKGFGENIYAQKPHFIKINSDSALGKIYKKYNPEINLDHVKELSIHHQGCFEENLAKDLKAVATSSDGLIEAVDLIGYPSLFIATQYHFEYNVGNIANGIFKELVR